MSDFKDITKLLAILDQEQEKLGTWVAPEEQLPFVCYGKAVYLLRDAIGSLPGKHPELELYEYQRILEEQGLRERDFKTADVSRMEAKTVAAMLVAVWRGERFCDGLLMDYLENGCIQRWLKRLQAIDEGR